MRYEIKHVTKDDDGFFADQTVRGYSVTRYNDDGSATDIIPMWSDYSVYAFKWTAKLAIRRDKRALKREKKHNASRLPDKLVYSETDNS